MSQKKTAYETYVYYYPMIRTGFQISHSSVERCTAEERAAIALAAAHAMSNERPWKKQDIEDLLLQMQ